MNKYANLKKSSEIKSEDFIPSYASFTIYFKWENDHLKIFGVKTKKTSDFPWGFSGGKEEIIDKGDPEKTRTREFLQETASEDQNEARIFFQITRRNNQGDGIFKNYFFYCFQAKIPKTNPKLSPKESVEGLSFFKFKEFDMLQLKQSHRIAFVEFCYFLEAKFPESSTLKEELKECSYNLFERPSTVGGVLMYKYDTNSGTSEYSEKLLSFLPQGEVLRGFKIFPNPKG